MEVTFKRFKAVNSTEILSEEDVKKFVFVVKDNFVKYTQISSGFEQGRWQTDNDAFISDLCKKHGVDPYSTKERTEFVSALVEALLP